MNDPKATCQCLSNKPSRESFEAIAQLFKAFADPTRLQLLRALQEKTKNVGELVKELDLTQANVSKHLQILFEANVLSREKRGTATYYSIDDEIVYQLCDLVCTKINRDVKGRQLIEFMAGNLEMEA